MYVEHVKRTSGEAARAAVKTWVPPPPPHRRTRSTFARHDMCTYVLLPAVLHYCSEEERKERKDKKRGEKNDATAKRMGNKVLFKRG